MTPGSGTRGSLCSSRKTFCKTCVSAIVCLLLLLGSGFFDRVSAEFAAQGGYDLHGEGVFDVAADAVQVGVLLEGALGEFEEPAAHHAALVPQAREGPEVVIVAGLLEDLEPLGVGLEHPVLDTVVDHLL